MLLFLSMSMFLPSCMTTKTSVKNFDELSGQDYYYAKGKQGYLFWGLKPIGKPSVTVPVDEPCQVKTTTTFVDGLVSDLTLGIYCMQSVQIIAKRQAPLNVGDEIKYFKGPEVCKGTLESIENGKKCLVRTEDGKLKKMNLMDVFK